MSKKESGVAGPKKNSKKHVNTRSPDIADKHKRCNFLKMAKKMVRKGNSAPPFASWDEMRTNKRCSPEKQMELTETLRK